MLTEPFESNQTKKWSQLTEHIKDLYQKVNETMIKPPSTFKLSDLIDSTTGEKIGVRIYRLGSTDNSSTEYTLLYCDIKNTDIFQFDQLSYNNLINKSGKDDDNLDLPTFDWKELIHGDQIIKDEELYEKLSLEEKIQLERKNMYFNGITSYEFHEKQRRFVVSLDSTLHYFDDTATAPYLPIKLPSKNKSAKVNPSICPTNADLVAYVSNDDLFVLNIQNGIELQLTNNKIDQPNRKLISGLPSFVIQEEFSRYSGFWWQPEQNNSNSINSNEFKIVFEEVDETDVEVLTITSFDGTCEEYRYPKPGKNNAISRLKIANFKIDPNTNDFHDVHVDFINNIKSLKQIYPDGEYLINCGWYSHDTIVVQLLTRKQQNLMVFLISIDNKFEPQVIHEEINERWIYVTQVCEFLRDEDDDKGSVEIGKEISFIWASQENGFRHLYKITAKISQSSDNLQSIGPLRSTILNKLQLTDGQWEVDDESVWLDNKRKLLYFIGLKDSPLERHLYVISLDDEQKFENVKRLTTSGYSNSAIIFNAQYDLFININSSISKPAFGFLNLIQFTQQNSNISQLSSVYKIGYILSNKIIKPDGLSINCIEEFEKLPGFSRPELFSYQLKESGDIIYGIIYKPDFMQAEKKYPCVLEIYGGPSVQLVSNNFRLVRQFHRHLLASQGYIVCVIDGRGSTNRGMAFEGHLNRRFGQVEVQDQVEVLQWLASNTNYIDLNKIAVHGYSYGGYLALMCLAQRPDIFRLGIAGGPTTDWKMYDTGYTERYMDTPENNEEGYAKGSVLNYVSNFPNEHDRLLIIHSLNDENVHFFGHSVKLINELIKANKPYSLQIYPNERHSIRKSHARIHYEAILLSFLNHGFK